MRKWKKRKLENKKKKKKIGEVNIKRNPTRNTLTLITYKQKINEKQLVIILYLEDKITNHAKIS